MGGWDGEPQFIDADSGYQNPKEDSLSFKGMALTQAQKVLNAGSKEFRGGYWREESAKNERGVTVIKKVYEPDSREECCGAINMLYIWISPKIENEKNKKPQFQDIKKEIKKILKAIDSAKKECLGRTEKKDSEILPTEFYGAADKEVIETYKHRNLALHLELFKQINMYMNMKNYFVSSGIEE